MKIGFDVSDLSTNRADGTTRYTYELAARLPQLSRDVQWVFFAPRHSEALRQVTEGKPNVQLSVTAWPSFWTQARLPFDVYAHRLDTLFMPIQQLPYIRPRRVRTVAVVHDLAVHRFPQQFARKDWLLLHVFSAQVAREADEIIAVSQATADDITRYYHRTAHVQVVHHGVDHTKFKPASDAVQRESWQQLQAAYPNLRKPYLLTVGQVQPRKNLVRLIEAFELLKKEQPQLTLVLAGSHGWLQQPILERVKSSSRAKDILMLGRVSDTLLPGLYQHAQVFVMPSLYEGFGMPVLEAMACGTPVVTSNVSSLPEVAADAAVLVIPESAAAIAVGIRDAWCRLPALAQKGMARAASFSWEATAKKTLRVLLAQ